MTRSESRSKPPLFSVTQWTPEALVLRHWASRVVCSDARLIFRQQKASVVISFIAPRSSTNIMEIRQTILRNIAERVARIVVSSRKFGAIYLRSGGEGS